MDFPIIIAIGLLSFLSPIPAEDDNCERVLRNGTCACCKSGYRGQTCNVSCERCKSRLLQTCEYFCEDRYYGTTCNKSCPEACHLSRTRVCKEENNLPVCIECIPGHYGRQCSQICNMNCLGMRCFLIDGRCLNCRNSQSYGDFCNITCSEGCKENTCNRTGHCTDGCSDGFYGDKCMKCGSNCIQAICTSDKYSTYNCTEGCIDGYTGTNCTEKCQPHCKKCDRQGNCKSCVEHYVLKDDTRECFKVRNISTPIKTVNHIPIVLGVVLPILIICGIIIGVVIWKTKRLHQSVFRSKPQKSASSESSISSLYQSDENVPQQCFITREGSDGDEDFNSNISSQYQSDEEENPVCLIQGNMEGNPDNSRLNQGDNSDGKKS